MKNEREVIVSKYDIKKLLPQYVEFVKSVGCKK